MRRRTRSLIGTIVMLAFIILYAPLAMALATIPEAAAWIGGGTTELRRSSVRYMTRSGTYSIEKARRELGFEPAVDLAEGMRRTEAWLREAGLLERS